MEKIVYFDYCALVLLTTLYFSALFRSKIKGKLSQCYESILIITIVSTIADICSIHLDILGAGYISQKYIAHSVYVSVRSLITPLYVVYIIYTTDTVHKIKTSVIHRMIFWMPITLATIVLIVNPFYPVLFYFDSFDNYTRGPLFWVLYFVAGWYMFYGLCFLWRYRLLFEKKKLLSLHMVIVMVLGAVIIQLFFPNIILEMFACAIGLLFIATAIQKPEEIIDTDSGMWKLSAYVNKLKNIFIVSKPIKIIMINLVNYQAVSDMLGYEGTNELLREIRIKLETMCQNDEFEAELYYLGHGRICMVLEGKYMDKADQIAEKINLDLKETMQIRQMNVSLNSCVCITKCPDDIGDVESVLTFCNDIGQKFYTGNVLYASDIYHKAYYDIMRDIDRIIEMAFTNERFEVYYQPIYSVEEKKFVTAEALLRLKDEKYGFISPELFIPAAEKSGAIHKIGEFVLESVCKFIASDEFKDLGIECIEVNLSVAQCMQTNLANEVIEIINKYNVKPSQINLEITETAASSSQNVMADNLTALTKAGISISLDDFGIGYSNMRRIASFPFEIVKLDKTFAASKEEGDDKMEIILENTIKMIKDMDMKIVVEGIETEELVKQFSDMRCEYIQGYYYSRPVAKKDFIEFIKNSQNK